MLNYQRLSIWGSVWRCFCSLLPTAETGLVVERQNRFVGCGGKKPLHPAWFKILFPTEWPWNIMKCCVLHFGQTQISSNAVVLQCRPLKWCTQNPEKPSPSLAELIKTPGMQVALRLAEWNPNRCPIHCAPKPGRGKQGPKANSKRSPTKPRFPSKRLPGECVWSWNYIQIGPDNPTFNSSQLSQAQLNLLNTQSSSWRTGLKLAPLLSLQIQSYAVRFTACHLFDANLHCIQVNVWVFNLLANSSVSSTGAPKDW